MKRGTRQHPKFKAFCSALGIPEYAGVGLLESLWMSVEEFQDDGAIGRWSDLRIADAIGWDRDAGQLVMCLIECELVDRVEGNDRLVVHDWLCHCSSYIWDRVKKRVQRARTSGAQIAPWLSAMVDKASTERSRNSPGNEVSVETSPETARSSQRRPAGSGCVRPRPAASGLSDPNPRPKTQDQNPRPAPTAVAVVGAGASNSAVLGDPAVSTTTTTSVGDDQPPNSECEVVHSVPCTDRHFEVDGGLLNSLQSEFPDLFVGGEVKALVDYLTTYSAKRRPLRQGLESVRNWLRHAQKNPDLRAQRPAETPAIAAIKSISVPRESAMDRKRREQQRALDEAEGEYLAGTKR